VSLGAFVSLWFKKACGEVLRGNKKPLRHHGTKGHKDFTLMYAKLSQRIEHQLEPGLFHVPLLKGWKLEN